MSGFSAGLFSQINYWAVLVAGLLAFFLGGLWYSPALFEEAWMDAHGYSREQVAAIPGSLGAVGFAAAAAAYLVMALVFAFLLRACGVASLAGGVLLGMLIWIGFAATIGLNNTLFSIRPLAAWVIDAGFQLVFLVATGIVLSLWR